MTSRSPSPPDPPQGEAAPGQETAPAAPPAPDRHGDEFLALLAHELRNPLAPIRNAVQVLRQRGADPLTVQWAGDVIDRQAQQLTGLVEDLFDVSRLTGNKLRLCDERLDLAALLRTVAEDQRGAVAEAGLTLEVDVPAEPVWLRGDRTRLCQVVGNLLDNARKFTAAPGQVRLRLSRADDLGRAVVSVSDTGIGIDSGLLPHVFETFTQGERGLERTRGGLGLGLALVKGLVELHGGQVRAASEGPGRGTELTFWLPLAEEPASPSGAAPPGGRAARPLRIVVIDDDRDTTRTLQVLLELAGHQVAAAQTGPEGLAMVQRFQPQVVVCDLGLPGMDGLEVARALRQDPGLSRLRLVAVSGYGRDEDRQRCLAAGFDLHLVKPVDPQELQRILAGLAN